MRRWAWAAAVCGLCLAGCDRGPPDQRLAQVEAELASERALHAETRRLLEAAQRDLAAAQRDRDDHSRRLTELTAELSAERARHAETRTRLEALQRERDDRSKRLAELESELAAEKAGHAETRTRLETVQRERDDGNKRLAERDTELAAEKAGHAETGKRLEAAQRDRDDRSKRLAALETELAAEKASHAETRKQLEAAQARALERQPRGFAGELYSAVLLDETELVAGRKGTYHAIRLLGPARESIPRFDLGSYRLDPTEHQEVARAMEELNREVVSVLAANRTVAVLVRGRANNIRFRTPGVMQAGLCSGNAISYLPYDRSVRKYATTATQQVLAGTYANEELPNLRAAFIACIAQAALQSAELFILQGEIADTTDNSALTADMFLFAGAR